MPGLRVMMPLATAAAVMGATIAGCSTTSHHTTRAPARSATEASSTPQPSTVAAVDALLGAEQRGDHGASFALLSADSRQVYPDVDAWAKHRSQLPAITGFQVTGGADAGEALATVTHRPGLDPLVGLSPAEDRERWHGRRVGGGWLVGADPDVMFVLPPDRTAVDAATAWAAAVQHCDQAGANALQAVTVLYVTGSPPSLCGSSGPISVGELTRLPPGPVSKDVVAQYGTRALSWARAIPVTAPVQLTIIVAPIGSQWKVLGLYA